MNEGSISALCPDWSDDERMNVLFAPFRSRELNPEAWTNKIKFWTDLIEKCCRQTNKCSVNLEELKTIFQRSGKSPYCLAEVLHEGVESGVLVDQGRYLQTLRQAQASWGGWVKGLGVQALQSLGDRLIGGSIEKAKLIVPSVAEILAKELLSTLQSAEETLAFNKHNIFTEDEMKAALEQEDSDEAGYLLECLMAQQKVVKSEGVYKVSLNGNRAALVDDIDKGVMKINATLKLLNSDLDKLEGEVENSRTKAKEYLKKGLRDSAKGHLKRAKRLENTLQLKLNQKSNIESVSEEILNAKSNEDVVQAYKAGLSALRASIVDKDVNEAEELTAEIGILLEKNMQMGDALSENVDLDKSDLADLEKELDALVKEGDGRTCGDTEEELDLMKQLENLSVVDDKISKQKQFEKVEEEMEKMFRDDDNDSIKKERSGKTCAVAV